MVMIEAMACGTPVVALRRGSVPEVVEHGVSGLIVNEFAEFPAALHAASELDPAACRRHARANFDLSVMADGYEAVYAGLTQSRLVLPEGGRLSVNDFAATGSGALVLGDRGRPPIL